MASMEVSSPRPRTRHSTPLPLTLALTLPHPGRTAQTDAEGGSEGDATGLLRRRAAVLLPGRCRVPNDVGGVPSWQGGRRRVGAACRPLTSDNLIYRVSRTHLKYIHARQQTFSPQLPPIAIPNTAPLRPATPSFPWHCSSRSPAPHTTWPSDRSPLSASRRVASCQLWAATENQESSVVYHRLPETRVRRRSTFQRSRKRGEPRRSCRKLSHGCARRLSGGRQLRLRRLRLWRLRPRSLRGHARASAARMQGRSSSRCPRRGCSTWAR